MTHRRLAVVLSALAVAGGVPACARATCCAPSRVAPAPAIAAGAAKPGTKVRIATVSWRVVQAPLETIVAAFGPGLEDGKFHARVPAPEEAAQLERSLEKGAKVRIVTAPRVTLVEGHEGHVAIVNEISYVSDFEVEAQGGAFIADPVVSVVAEGLDADVTVDRADVGPKYLLTLKVGTRSIERPMREETLSIAAVTAPLRVQRPVVSAQGIQTRVPLADGGSVFLASTNAAIGEFAGPLLVWVTVEDSGEVVVGEDSDVILAPSNFVPPQTPFAPVR